MSVTGTIMHILVYIRWVGLLSNYVKYNTFVIFLTALSFFLDPAPRSNRWTDFHALWLKRRVSTQGSAFGDITIGDVIMQKYAPKPLKVSVMDRQIQAKMQKSKNRTISVTVNTIKPKF